MDGAFFRLLQTRNFTGGNGFVCTGIGVPVARCFVISPTILDAVQATNSSLPVEPTHIVLSLRGADYTRTTK